MKKKARFTLAKNVGYSYYQIIWKLKIIIIRIWRIRNISYLIIWIASSFFWYIFEIWFNFWFVELKRYFDEKWNFKVSSANHRTNLNVIHSNWYNYFLSTICTIFRMLRNAFYYKTIEKWKKTKSFGLCLNKSKNNYGIYKNKLA